MSNLEWGKRAREKKARFNAFPRKKNTINLEVFLTYVRIYKVEKIQQQIRRVINPEGI